MAIQIAVRTSRLISVHDEPSTMRLELSSITPGTYFIPGINASDEEFRKCVFSFRGREPVQYAQLRELNGHKYVEVQVFEGKTAQYGTELDQKLDEYGQKMDPPLRRALLPVPPEEIANELEKQASFFSQNLGVKAIDHEPIFADIQAAEKENIRYMQATVAQTNKWSKVGNGINITEQARNHAWRLHKMQLLNPLPEWATVNPEGGALAADTMNCVGCGSVIPKKSWWCPTANCPVIYDWKEAVSWGKIPPRDVPPNRRREAGLEGYSNTASTLAKQEAKEKVAASFAARDAANQE